MRSFVEGMKPAIEEGLAISNGTAKHLIVYMDDMHSYLVSCVKYFEEGKSPLGTPWFDGLKKLVEEKLEK